jgi:hypothetical protein
MPKKIKDVLLGTCGHINNQYYGLDGELEEISCELSTGHEGDHQADTQYVEPFLGHAKIHKGKETIERDGVTYVILSRKSHWNDAAGKKL